MRIPSLSTALSPSGFCVSGGKVCGTRGMREPYIYTLPEQFIKDPSVPVHWKLYGILNGFWISGKPVYASNNFFAEKLGTTDRHIRRSLETLEGMGLVDRQIEGLQRYIYPGGGRTASVLGGGRYTSERADAGGPHISISNSINTLGADKPRIEVISEKEKPERQKADTSYLRVFEAWGEYPLNWRRNVTEIESAKNILIELTIEDVLWAIKTYEKYKDRPYCPTILKPSDLDRKWDALVAFSKKNK